MNSKNALRKLIVNSVISLETIDDFYSLFSGLTEKDQEKIYDLFRCQIESLVKKDIQDLKKIINVLNSKDALSKLIVNSRIPLETIDNFYSLFSRLTEEKHEDLYVLFKDKLLTLANDGTDIAKILNFLPPDAFNKFFIEKQEILQSIIPRNGEGSFKDIKELFINLDKNKLTDTIRCFKKTDLASHFQSPLVVKYLISDLSDDKKLKVFESMAQEKLVRPIRNLSDLQDLIKCLNEKEIKALCQDSSFQKSLHSITSSFRWKYIVKWSNSKSYRKIKEIFNYCSGEFLFEKSTFADNNLLIFKKTGNENREKNPNPNNDSNSNLVPGIENNTVRIK